MSWVAIHCGLWPQILRSPEAANSPWRRRHNSPPLRPLHHCFTTASRGVFSAAFSGFRARSSAARSCGAAGSPIWTAAGTPNAKPGTFQRQGRGFSWTTSNMSPTGSISWICATGLPMRPGSSGKKPRNWGCNSCAATGSTRCPHPSFVNIWRPRVERNPCRACFLRRCKSPDGLLNCPYD